MCSKYCEGWIQRRTHHEPCLVWPRSSHHALLRTLHQIFRSTVTSKVLFFTFSILDKLFWNCDKDIFFYSLSAELAVQQERKTLREYLANMKVAESSGSWKKIGPSWMIWISLIHCIGTQVYSDFLPFTFFISGSGNKPSLPCALPSCRWGCGVFQCFLDTGVFLMLYVFALVVV